MKRRFTRVQPQQRNNLRKGHQRQNQENILGRNRPTCQRRLRTYEAPTGAPTPTPDKHKTTMGRINRSHATSEKDSRARIHASRATADGDMGGSEPNPTATSPSIPAPHNHNPINRQ